MSYNKNIWKRKDRITKEKLNHMEDGIYDAHNKLTTTSKKINDLSSQIKEVKNNFFYDKLTNIEENHSLEDMNWNRTFVYRYMMNKRLKLSELCIDYDLLNVEGGIGHPYKIEGDHTLTVSKGKLTSKNNKDTKSTCDVVVGKLEPFSTVEGIFTDLPSIGGDYCGLELYANRLIFNFKIIKKQSNYALRILHYDLANNTDILSDTDIVTLENINSTDKIKLVISTNNGKDMDLYYEINNEGLIFAHTYNYNDGSWWGDIRKVGSTSRYKVTFRLSKDGYSSCMGCSSYYDSGVGQHNMTLIKYENGQPIIKDGKVFFNMGVSSQNGA